MEEREEYRNFVLDRSGIFLHVLDNEYARVMWCKWWNCVITSKSIIHFLSPPSRYRMVPYDRWYPMHPINRPIVLCCYYRFVWWILWLILDPNSWLQSMHPYCPSLYLLHPSPYEWIDMHGLRQWHSDISALESVVAFSWHWKIFFFPCSLLMEKVILIAFRFFEIWLVSLSHPS